MTTKPREIDSPAEAAKVTPLLARQALPEPPRDAEPGRNPGMPLALDWLDEVRLVNRSALERRAATLTKRRSIKGDNQAAWLLKAIALMDLTSLNSNDTDERVRRLCAKAIRPLRSDLVEGLGLGAATIRPSGASSSTTACTPRASASPSRRSSRTTIRRRRRSRSARSRRAPK